MILKTKDLVRMGFFLALGLILPYIFHMAGMIGTIFLPMHIPVLLCGFLLGKRYGLILGIITPFLNSILTGMPPLYPVAIAMALELAVYGFLSGYLYKDRKYGVFVSLIAAMIIGRLISGAANYLLLSANGNSYLLSAFIADSFVTPVWGIAIQLVLVPVIVKLTGKSGVTR